MTDADHIAALRRELATSEKEARDQARLFCRRVLSRPALAGEAVERAMRAGERARRLREELRKALMRHAADAVAAEVQGER